MTLKQLLKSYFSYYAQLSGKGYEIKRVEERGAIKKDALENRVINAVEVEICFKKFGKYEEFAKLLLFYLFIDGLSITSSATKLKKQKIPWKHAINSNNLRVDIQEIISDFETEARKRNILT